MSNKHIKSELGQDLPAPSQKNLSISINVPNIHSAQSKTPKGFFALTLSSHITSNTPSSRATVTSLLTPSFSILLPYFKGSFPVSPHWNVTSVRQARARCSVSGICHALHVVMPQLTRHSRFPSWSSVVSRLQCKQKNQIA